MTYLRLKPTLSSFLSDIEIGSFVNNWNTFGRSNDNWTRGINEFSSAYSTINKVEAVLLESSFSFVHSTVDAMEDCSRMYYLYWICINVSWVMEFLTCGCNFTKKMNGLQWNCCIICQIFQIKNINLGDYYCKEKKTIFVGPTLCQFTKYSIFLETHSFYW